MGDKIIIEALFDNYKDIIEYYIDKEGIESALHPLRANYDTLHFSIRNYKYDYHEIRAKRKIFTCLKQLLKFVKGDEDLILDIKEDMKMLKEMGVF
jgi:hypothetical protein